MDALQHHYIMRLINCKLLNGAASHKVVLHNCCIHMSHGASIPKPMMHFPLFRISPSFQNISVWEYFSNFFQQMYVCFIHENF